MLKLEGCEYIFFDIRTAVTGWIFFAILIQILVTLQQSTVLLAQNQDKSSNSSTSTCFSRGFFQLIQQFQYKLKFHSTE